MDKEIRVRKVCGGCSASALHSNIRTDRSDGGYGSRHVVDRITCQNCGYSEPISETQS